MSASIEVDDTTFAREVLEADTPVLVEFGATWCAPCRALAPVVERIAEERRGQCKVVTVDIDDAPRVAKTYGIRSAPTLMVFSGGEKRAVHLGLTSRETIVAMLER